MYKFRQLNLAGWTNQESAYPHAAEGERATNSQAKKLIPDGTLESCIRSTEEAIPAGRENLSGLRTERAFFWRALFSLNKEKLVAFDQVVTTADLLDDKYLLVQRGKKNYYLIIAK